MAEVCRKISPCINNFKFTTRNEAANFKCYVDIQKCLSEYVYELFIFAEMSYTCRDMICCSYELTDVLVRECHHHNVNKSKELY